MALSLGKLTILVGAGLVGSVIAKEGRLPDVSNLVSGAFKVVFKQLKSNDSAPPVKKPYNDALMAQVNSLQQELRLLARDRSITIVNASGTGGRKYVTVIVIVVVGYGYVWWKGWKLPGMMFATRRSLSDACTSIGNQLGKIYESIEEAKKKLSSRMNGLDKSLDECAALSENTKEEVSVIQKATDSINEVLRALHVKAQVLDSKFKEIEVKQVITTEGVHKLLKTAEHIQASSSSSSMPALELPPVSPSSRATLSGPSRLSLEPPSFTPTSRTALLPPTRSIDPPSPSNTVGSDQESSGRISEERNFSSSRVDSKKTPAENKTNASSSGFFGLKLPGVYAPFLTRTRSATDAVVQQTRSSS